MTVRSGMIDDFDALDELHSLVAHCEPLNRYEAEEIVPKVRALLAAGIAGTALSVANQKVCVCVVETDRERIQAKIARLGLSDKVTILPHF